MPSRSSTFSSEVRRSALPWMVTTIVVLELCFRWIYGNRLFAHEVDEALAELEAAPATDVVVLGDSVGRQLTDNARSQDVTVLATNQAAEIPGHYYLLERYLSTHTRPRYV